MTQLTLGETDQLSPEERKIHEWRLRVFMEIADGDEESAHLLLAADPPVDLDSIRRAKARGWPVRELVRSFS